ncbi:MAG: PhzF family phenazine biosynthesis protein [bacterium]|nr:PhzF family phenazine biosynthesis protein [bacterium]
MDRRFYIADVFAEKKYAGNQLAVIRDSRGLTDEELMLITREMNYSETTFLLSDEQEDDGGYNVRIFTPGEEVPFAGHPTLGTAYIIQQEIIKSEVEEVKLNLKIGQIPVKFSYANGKPDILWMTQKPPQFGTIIDSQEIARVLGIEVDDIDPRFPIQEATTGLPFIIVPLKSLKAVKSCQTDTKELIKLVEKYDAKNILVFSNETYNPENQINVRVFVDFLGIPEDPATGSANGALAGYLVKYRYFSTTKIDLRVEQGYEMKRESLLLLKAEERDGLIDVQVGGRVQMIARGELL